MRRWIIRKLLRSLTKDSGLRSHAQRELTDSDSEWREHVLDVVCQFSLYGHSGGSAPPTIETLRSLLLYAPLGPLTGEDDEWNESSLTPGTQQNRRCSHVFKGADGAYDIQGKIFRESDGCTYTSFESHVAVTFPYTPKSEYVDVPKDEPHPGSHGENPDDRAGQGS